VGSFSIFEVWNVFSCESGLAMRRLDFLVVGGQVGLIVEERSLKTSLIKNVAAL